MWPFGKTEQIQIVSITFSLKSWFKKYLCPESENRIFSPRTILSEKSFSRHFSIVLFYIHCVLNQNNWEVSLRSNFLQILQLLVLPKGHSILIIFSACFWTQSIESVKFIEKSDFRSPTSRRGNFEYVPRKMRSEFKTLQERMCTEKNSQHGQ